MVNEEWKTIDCLKHKPTIEYEASNFGRIRNKLTGKIRKPNESVKYYYYFSYYWKDEDGKSHFCKEYWHRVIAKTWLPQQEGMNEIDHIDRNPANNTIENLRWVDSKTQQNNKSSYPKRKHSINKPLWVIYKQEGNRVEYYPTAREAIGKVPNNWKAILLYLEGRHKPFRKVDYTQTDPADKIDNEK